eukprot:3451750-Prymnesium_polylepis.1
MGQKENSTVLDSGRCPEFSRINRPHSNTTHSVTQCGTPECFVLRGVCNSACVTQCVTHDRPGSCRYCEAAR